MPTRAELLATGRTVEEIAREIGADGVIYQDLGALRDAVHEANNALNDFEMSCFDGRYVTGDITDEYLAEIEGARSESKPQREEALGGGADLNLNVAEQNLM